MQLHISPSLRHVTVLPGKGVREFTKVKVGLRRVSYRMLFYSLLFFAFLLRFVFVLSSVDSIDGDHSKCSTIGKFSSKAYQIKYCFSSFDVRVQGECTCFTRFMRLNNKAIQITMLQLSDY